MFTRPVIREGGTFPSLVCVVVGCPHPPYDALHRLPQPGRHSLHILTWVLSRSTPRALARLYPFVLWWVGDRPWFLSLFLFFSGFEYNERSILGVNAASKWAQELAELNLAAVATPFYKGYKVLYDSFAY